MNSLVYHAGKFINDDDLNSPDAATAHRSWELSKYTTQELKKELASREGANTPKLLLACEECELEGRWGCTHIDTGHYGHMVDITSQPNWCSDCQKEFYADF